MKLRHLAVASASILLAVRMFRMVDLYAVNIFFCDQWAFNDATLFQKHSWLEIFRWQYGPHRQGLGGVLLKLYEPFIQWNSREDAFVIAGIIVCACLAALWLKYRLFGSIGYSDVIIPLLFFTPVQFDALIVDGVNPSHGPLPLLLAVLYCLAWTIPKQFWKHATVLLLNLALIYTGFGLFMGLITPVLLGIEFYHHRKRLVLISLAIAIISIGSFFIDYRNVPAVACFSPRLQNPLQYILFVGFMFSSFVNIFPRAPLVVPAMIVGIGLLILILLTEGNMFRKLLRDKAEGRSLIVFALLGYSLVFCFATSYGRICMGLASGQASRYMIYLILAFLGLYLAALSVTANVKSRAFVSVALLLALLSSIPFHTQAQRSLSSKSQQRRTWKECYLSTHNIEQCDVRSGSFIYLTPEPPDLKSKLDFLERNHLNLFSGVTTPPH